MYEQLYADNRRLLYAMAKRYTAVAYRDPAVDRDDLVQAGALGLIRAEQTYNPERGEWVSWAALYIKNEMRRALGLRETKEFITVLSLDAPLLADGADDVTLGDTIADEKLEPTEETTERADTTRRVRAAVDALPVDSRRLVDSYIEHGMVATTAARALGMEPRQYRDNLHKAFYMLARNAEVRALADLDDRTGFISRKSAQRFNSDWTSDVEAEAMKRISAVAQIESAHTGANGARRAEAQLRRWS